MKITHLTTVHSPNDVRIFHKQVKSLAEAGHQVTLIATGNGAPKSSNDGVTITLLRKPKGKITRLFITGPALVHRAFATRADIYHFHDPELIPWCMALKLFGRRVVMDVHEDYPANVLGMTWIPYALRPVIAVIVRAMLAFAVRVFDGVVTASDELRDRFRALRTADRVVAANNYPVVDIELLRAPIECHRYEARRIFFLGGLNKYRAFPDFFAALGLLDDLPFVVLAGGNYNDDELLTAARQTHAWTKVEYFGQISVEQVNPTMLACSISVNLYANLPNHHQIRSNRLYEAMAAGLPVVVSDFPRWHDFVERYQCGIAVNPHDPADVAKGLRRLLEDPKLCMAFGLNGRNAVLSQFTWASQAEEISRLYERIT